MENTFLKKERKEMELTLEEKKLDMKQRVTEQELQGKRSELALRKVQIEVDVCKSLIEDADSIMHASDLNYVLHFYKNLQVSSANLLKPKLGKAIPTRLPKSSGLPLSYDDANGFGKLWLSSGESLDDSVNQFQPQSTQPALITSHEEAKKLDDPLSAHINRKQENISPTIFDLPLNLVDQGDGGFLGHTLPHKKFEKGGSGGCRRF